MTILCVTPNPALDRTLVQTHLAPGEIHRVQTVIERAGGKGLNVARVVDQLGGQALAIAPLAGTTGRRVAALAELEGTDASWVWLDDLETRTCTIIVTDDGESTVFNEAGPVIGEQWPQLVARVGEVCRGGQITGVAISGSVPPGVGGDEFTALIDAIRAATAVPLWIDSSGAALRFACDCEVSLKVNLAEAREFLGVADESTDDVAQTARRMWERSKAAAVVVTDGPNGAAFANGEVLVTALAPSVEVRNAIGSGDAFLAGLVVELASGAQPDDALCVAIAAGTANATEPGPTVDAVVVRELRRRISSSTTHTKGSRHG